MNTDTSSQRKLPDLPSNGAARFATYMGGCIAPLSITPSLHTAALNELLSNVSLDCAELKHAGNYALLPFGEISPKQSADGFNEGMIKLIKSSPDSNIYPLKPHKNDSFAKMTEGITGNYACSSADEICSPSASIMSENIALQRIAPSGGNPFLA